MRQVWGPDLAFREIPRRQAVEVTPLIKPHEVIGHVEDMQLSVRYSLVEAHAILDSLHRVLAPDDQWRAPEQVNEFAYVEAWPRTTKANRRSKVSVGTTQKSNCRNGLRVIAQECPPGLRWAVLGLAELEISSASKP